MPNIESIQQFNTNLINIGREMEIVKERGEKIEEVQKPEPGFFKEYEIRSDQPDGEPSEPQDPQSNTPTDISSRSPNASTKNTEQLDSSEMAENFFARMSEALGEDEELESPSANQASEELDPLGFGDFSGTADEATVDLSEHSSETELASAEEASSETELSPSIEDISISDLNLEEFMLTDSSPIEVDSSQPTEREVEISEVSNKDLNEAEFVLDDAAISEIEEELDKEQKEEFSISEDNFAILQEHLASLPINLRLAIAQIISSDKYEASSIKELITGLIEKYPPQNLARKVSLISGKHIVLPHRLTKQQGSKLEEEQDTFQYRFREVIWPTIRLMLLFGVILAGLVLGSYNFIYRPLTARNLYIQGLESIAVENYDDANRLFDRAYRIWPIKKRFLDFAQAYREQRQFLFAREKYEELLSDDVDPLYRLGILEYSRFAIYELRDYEVSLEYLDRLLEENVWDYEALLLRGDTFIEWGIQFDNQDRRSELFEQARFVYASLIGRYGEEDELLFKMLRYFILTENVEEALDLKNYFLNNERAVLDPYGMTDLAGFLLDLHEESYITKEPGISPVENYLANFLGDDRESDFLIDARSVIDKVFELNQEIPSTHYQLARYAREVEDISLESTALENAVELYEVVNLNRPLNRFEAAEEIDAYIRSGELSQRFDEILAAESQFLQAIQLYERALNARSITPEPRYGRVYAALGDIYYYNAGDFVSAEELYLLARQNKYGSLNEYPERFAERQGLAYKLGYIYLFEANAIDINPIGTNRANSSLQIEKQDLLDAAITEFNNAIAAIPSSNLNLLYARANTQYLRQNYNDAVGLYRILINELNTARASISTFLLEEDDRHKALIDFQIRANNNLGAALYRLYQQGGSNEHFAQSQLYLSRSTELAENLARDPETAIRADTRPLAFLNLQSILAPVPIDNIQIDPDIRKDLYTPFF